MSASVGDNEAEVNLTPLLDVVLQLIMFFMITVNFVRVDQLNADIVLPPVQNAVPLDRSADNWVFLNMDKDGRVLVSSGEELDVRKQGKLRRYVEQAREQLIRSAREAGKTADIRVVIVLRAHKDCRYRDVWEVLDICNKAGYNRWQLRVMYQPKS